MLEEALLSRLKSKSQECKTLLDKQKDPVSVSKEAERKVLLKKQKTQMSRLCSAKTQGQLRNRCTSVNNESQVGKTGSRAGINGI